MAIIEDVEKILHDEFGANLGKESIDPDEDLLARGVIDSLGVMKLITALEKTFGVHVADEDVVPENFQSLKALADFVELKVKNR